MATTKEIKEHLEIALAEVGEIKPWFDKDFNTWIFSHPAYPVEYSGDTPKEVIKNYPKYLREFITERLNDNLSPLTEKKTKGRGGCREGAGRPIGSFKEEKIRIYVPIDVANWLKHPGAIQQVREMMHHYTT